MKRIRTFQTIVTVVLLVAEAVGTVVAIRAFRNNPPDYTLMAIFAIAGAGVLIFIGIRQAVVRAVENAIIEKIVLGNGFGNNASLKRQGRIAAWLTAEFVRET